MFSESKVASDFLSGFGMLYIGVSNRYWRPIVSWHVDAVLRSRSLIILSQYKVNVYLRRALSFLQAASLESRTYCLLVETQASRQGAGLRFFRKFAKRRGFLFIGKWHPGAFTNSVLTRWHFTHTLALLGELDHFYPGAFPDVAIIGNSFKDNDALFEINTMNIPVVALISPTMEFYGQLVTYPVFGDSAYLSARMFLYNLCAKAWIEGQLIQFTLNKCDRLKRPYYLMRSTVMFRRYLFRRASIRKNRQYLWKYIDGLSVGVTAL